MAFVCAVMLLLVDLWTCSLAVVMVSLSCVLLAVFGSRFGSMLRTYGAASLSLLLLLVCTGTGCVFVAGWRHALRSEWPFIIIIITGTGSQPPADVCLFEDLAWDYPVSRSRVNAWCE